MKLYLIRHGQTEFNKTKVPQGQEIDASLNETGIKQVEEVVQYLPNDIDFIISSPLKRAAETATILNKTLNKRIEFNDDVKELRYGTLAGKIWSEIAILLGDPDAYQHDHDLIFDYRKYGGDSIGDLKKRVLKFVTETREKYPDKNILVATHGGIIDTMHLLFPQTERKETKNATIHEFQF